MKTLGWILAVLLAMTVIAWTMSPEQVSDGRTQLVWSTDDNPVRQAQVDLFNQLNPDVRLVIDPANRDQQKVIVQSLGGVGPDLFDCYDMSFLQAYVRSGVAMDVTDDLRRAGIDFGRDVWDSLRPLYVYEGRAYGLPANASANAIWFNKSVFEDAGVPFPSRGWTWDEFLETARKLTVRDSRGRPKRFGMYLDFNLAIEKVYQNGGSKFSEDMTRCVVDSPAAIEAVQFGQDLMHKYRVAPTPAEEAALSTQGGWNSGGMTYLMAGRVGMAWGGRWWLNMMRKEKGLRLGVVEVPYSKREVTIGAGRSTLINAKSKHSEAAKRFILYLASKEYNELINDQADAMAPFKQYSYTERFMFNADFPGETDNDVWRSAMEKSIVGEVNPFAQGAELAPLNNQIDLVKAGVKNAEPAMRQAARDMTERILRNARQTETLRKLYFQLSGRMP